jgi:hypothetical protein
VGRHELWRTLEVETVAQIARNLHMTRKSVAKWIKRALAVGVEAALKDPYHRPKAPSITEEARAWVASFFFAIPSRPPGPQTDDGPGSRFGWRLIEEQSCGGHLQVPGFCAAALFNANELECGR